jgi:hypothetical protein
MDAITYLSFAVLVLLFFTVPGWLWLRRAGVDPLIAVYAGPGATALAAAAIVGLGVVLPWSVRTTCEGGAVVIVLATILCGLTAPRPLAPPRVEMVGMVVFAVAFISMASFSAVPSNPYAEWSGDTVGPGRVDSPRWPGLPSDNTLPFRTGQVALYKQGGANIRDQYSVGWWLSDRTPLTGLDFAFAAGATGIGVSSDNVEEIPVAQVPMEIRDAQGFWSYQVVAIYLNLAIILGVYLMARVWIGRRVAAIASLVAALLPGLFLNGIYTWPKQAIAYFVLIAAACAIRRRPVLAGAFAALGYLTHPAGVFWIPAVGILLFADADLRRQWRNVGARFLAPVVVLVAPWELFTSQAMHATSRWTTAPLGYLMTDPTHFGSQLSIAWHDFKHNGIMFALWERVQSTAASIFPIDLNDTPSYLGGRGGFRPQIMVSWVGAHGFSVWGMVGIVLFPFTLAFIVREWDRFRRVTLAFVAPAVILAELGNGLAYPFANQSMFTLVGLLAISAAWALTAARVRTRAVVVCCMAFELLTIVYGGLFRPVNAGLGSVLVLTAIAVIGQLALLGTLAASLGLIPGPRLAGVPGLRWVRRLAWE